MFTVYSKDNCGYCVKAYTLLEQKGAVYKKEVLDTEEKLHNFKSLGYKQVPQIFYNEEYIGGYDKLVEWYKNKEIEEDSAFD